MRGVLAVAVLSVGLGMAAYSFMPDVFEKADPEITLASSAANAATVRELPDQGRLPEFSPGSGLRPAVSEGASWFESSDEATTRLSSFSGRFAEAQAEATPPPPARFTRSVALEPWRAAVLVEATGLGPNGTQVSSRYLSAEQRLQLVTELQNELTRVGCYAGEASGSWNRETRAAVATFMDRVNAVLPLDEPDFTLLELVRAHPRLTCEAACPEGQSFDTGGRCVPLVVLAQARRPSQTALKSASKVIASTPPSAQRPLAIQVASAAPAEAFPAPMGLGAGTLGSASRALETEALEELTPKERAAVSQPVTEMPSRPAAKSKARKVASAPHPRRYTSSYRHVQHIFEHPLGRL